MAFVRESVCQKCGRPFVWSIDRPGDGFWDRWKSDNGNTLASWFLSNSQCWDHAWESIPERFRPMLRTVSYTEGEPAQQSAAS